METELFVHFAEIAGVFVGFGALISLRSTHLSDPHDVVFLRAVLALGVWVVVAGLLPIAISRYGVRDHALWLTCSLVAFVAWATFVITFVRTAESRAVGRSPERLDRLFPIVGVPLHLVIAGSLVLVIVGVSRRADEALYVTALTAAIIFAGYTLLALVMSQRHDTGTDRDDA